MTVSWIVYFLIIETAGFSLLLFLRGMDFCSGSTLYKLDPDPFKKETSKLSLGIISSGVFGIFYGCKILLCLLDTEVVLDSSNFLTVSSLFFYGGNICVDYVILLFDRGNGCSIFFSIINFWLGRLFFFIRLSRLFFFIKTLSLATLSIFSNSGQIKLGNIYYSLSTP